MAPRLLALVAFVLLALPSAPARAQDCTPLTLTSYTRGAGYPTAQAPAVCVEAYSATVDGVRIAWASPAREMQATLYREYLNDDNEVRFALLRAVYTDPVDDAPTHTLYWTQPSVEPTLLQIVEWQDAQLVGISQYAWPAPSNVTELPYQLGLPALAS